MKGMKGPTDILNTEGRKKVSCIEMEGRKMASGVIRCRYGRKEEGITVEMEGRKKVSVVEMKGRKKVSCI